MTQFSDVMDCMESGSLQGLLMMDEVPPHRNGKGGVAGGQLLDPGCLPSCPQLCLHPENVTARHM